MTRWTSVCPVVVSWASVTADKVIVYRPCFKSKRDTKLVTSSLCARTVVEIYLTYVKFKIHTSNRQTPFTTSRNNNRHTTTQWVRSSAVSNSYRTACKWLTPRYSENWQQNQIESRLLKKKPMKQGNVGNHRKRGMQDWPIKQTILQQATHEFAM